MNSYFIELPSGRYINADNITLISKESVKCDNPSVDLSLEDISYLRILISRDDGFIPYRL